MEWSNEKNLEFIEIYKSHPVLWCHRFKDYKEKLYRVKALQDLCTKMKCDVKMAKAKIKNLRSYFHKEHAKVLKRRLIDPKYDSAWFAYKALFFILDDKQEYIPQQMHTSKDEESTADEALRNNYQHLHEVPHGQQETGTDTSTKFVQHEIEDTIKLNEDHMRCPSTKKRKNLQKSKCSKPQKNISTSAKSSTNIKELQSTIIALNEVVENCKTTNVSNITSISPPKEDEFDAFGHYIALQLRTLPLQISYELQTRIQYMITQVKLTELGVQKTMTVDP